MKNKILVAITLSLMTVYLSAFVAPVYGAEDKHCTTTTAQEELVEGTNEEEDVLKEGEIETINNKIDAAIQEMNWDMQRISRIEDKYTWYVLYKSILTKYKDVLDIPETIYDYYTADELNLLFSVVQAEIGDEYSFDQKCNVASVILNRVKHDKFPNSINDVLNESQFTTIRNGSYKNVVVSDFTIAACEYVFEFGDTTGGALFFDSDGSLMYDRICFDGVHNFYKTKGE